MDSGDIFKTFVCIAFILTCLCLSKAKHRLDAIDKMQAKILSNQLDISKGVEFSLTKIKEMQ
jgi:hypothetical protein